MQSTIPVGSTLEGEVRVDPTAHIGPNCHLQGRISVEAGAVLVGGITLSGDIEIGKDVHVEPGVCLAASLPHNNEAPPPVRVGAKAHLGAGTVLRAGVTIGTGAWIEPGTVVTRNIPPHAIVGGTPATITGYFDNVDSQLRKKTSILLPPDTSGVKHGLVDGVTLHRFGHIRDLRGDLTVGEFERDVPFRPNRYFIVFDVPSSETRGEHAHKRCHQFLVCVGGSVSVVVDDGIHREEVLLDRPNIGLFIPAGIWGIQYKYSLPGSLLVFASEHYDPDDYIRNYEDFLRFKGVNA
jgi:serine acetyltransferase